MMRALILLAGSSASAGRAGSINAAAMDKASSGRTRRIGISRRVNPWHGFAIRALNAWVANPCYVSFPARRFTRRIRGRERHVLRPAPRIEHIALLVPPIRVARLNRAIRRRHRPRPIRPLHREKRGAKFKLVP